MRRLVPARKPRTFLSTAFLVLLLLVVLLGGISFFYAQVTQTRQSGTTALNSAPPSPLTQDWQYRWGDSAFNAPNLMPDWVNDPRQVASTEWKPFDIGADVPDRKGRTRASHIG